MSSNLNNTLFIATVTHLFNHAGDDERILEDVLTEVLVEPDALLLYSSRSDFVIFAFSLLFGAFHFGHFEEFLYFRAFADFFKNVSAKQIEQRQIEN